MKSLDFFKQKIIGILDKQEKEESAEMHKSFAFRMELLLEKGGHAANIGEVRTWNGRKYKKMPDKKWVRVYGVHDRHAEISIARLKGRVRNAESVDELLDIVMHNTHRFTDKDGHLLPVVLELKNEVDIKKSTLQARQKAAFETLKSFVNQKNYNKCSGLTKEEIFAKYDNSLKTIAIIPKVYTDYLGVKSDELKCGEAYMFDHMVNHRPATPLALYKRIQYILNTSKDFYYDTKNESFALTENFRTDSKGKPKKNILLFLKEGGRIVLYKTFYDTSKNLPGKFKKINLAEKKGLNSGADSLTAISQSEKDSDSAFRLNIQGRPDNSSIQQTESFSTQKGKQKKCYLSIADEEIKKALDSSAFYTARSMFPDETAVSHADINIPQPEKKGKKMRLVIKKSVMDELENILGKSKIIYVPASENHQAYQYVSGRTKKQMPQPSKAATRVQCANDAPLVKTNIEPLQITPQNFKQVAINESKKLDKKLKGGVHICRCLNKKVVGANINHSHYSKKLKRERTFAEMVGHTPYLPFAIPVIENGILNTALSKNGFYEVTGRIEIRKNKKRIGVSVILADTSKGLELNHVSVFRIKDNKGMIKSLPSAIAHNGTPLNSFQNPTLISKDLSFNMGNINIPQPEKKGKKKMRIVIKKSVMDENLFRLWQRRLSPELCKEMLKLINDKNNLSGFIPVEVYKIKGFPKGQDLENCELLELGDTYFVISCAVDWQDEKLVKFEIGNDDKLSATVVKNCNKEDRRTLKKKIAYICNSELTKSLTFSGHKLQDRTTFNGLNISIENKKGSVRCGVDKDGHKWAAKMHFDYGCIRGPEGVDGDHVDVYLGGNENAGKVYIVHQNDPVTGKYDEDKCMLGFNSLLDAKKAYLRQYDRPGFLGKIVVMKFEDFKDYILKKKNHGKKIVVKKSFYNNFFLLKASLPVGYVSTYKDGTKHKKIAPNKWVLVNEKQSILPKKNIKTEKEISGNQLSGLERKLDLSKEIIDIESKYESVNHGENVLTDSNSYLYKHVRNTIDKLCEEIDVNKLNDTELSDYLRILGFCNNYTFKGRRKSEYNTDMILHNEHVYAVKEICITKLIKLFINKDKDIKFGVDTEKYYGEREYNGEAYFSCSIVYFTINGRQNSFHFFNGKKILENILGKEIYRNKDLGEKYIADAFTWDLIKNSYKLPDNVYKVQAERNFNIDKENKILYQMYDYISSDIIIREKEIVSFMDKEFIEKTINKMRQLGIKFTQKELKIDKTGFDYKKLTSAKKRNLFETIYKEYAKEFYMNEENNIAEYKDKLNKKYETIKKQVDKMKKNNYPIAYDWEKDRYKEYKQKAKTLLNRYKEFVNII